MTDVNVFDWATSDLFAEPEGPRFLGSAPARPGSTAVVDEILRLRAMYPAVTR